MIDPTACEVIYVQSWAWQDYMYFLTESPIRRRELLTMILGLRVVADILPSGVRLRIDCMHDNTTAESRQRKWASAHEGENVLLSAIHDVLADTSISNVTTRLVPTGRQLADAGTRRNPLF